MPCLSELRRIRFLLERIAPPAPLPFCDGVDGRKAIEIREFVSKRFRITSEQMCHRRKFADIAWPRMFSMALCRKLTGLSLQQIAEMHGCHDHNSVSNAVGAVKDRCDTEPAMRVIFNELESELTKNQPKGKP